MLCAHISYLYYTEWINCCYKNLLYRGPQCLCFSKNYSLGEVTNLLIKFRKATSYLQNTNNTDINGINEQKPHHAQRKMTLETVK